MLMLMSGDGDTDGGRNGGGGFGCEDYGNSGTEY